MIAAAKAQDQVLAIPAPTVLFAEFGDWALKFNLICFVDDIELGERTRSDINFDVLRRMREAGLRIAYPAPRRRTPWIAGGSTTKLTRSLTPPSAPPPSR